MTESKSGIQVELERIRMLLASKEQELQTATGSLQGSISRLLTALIRFGTFFTSEESGVES